MKRKIITALTVTLLIMLSILPAHIGGAADAAERQEPMPITEEYCAVTRIYADVRLTSCIINYKYKSVGFATFKNTTSNDAMLCYSQGMTKSTQWDVTENISGNKSLEALVLAKIQAVAGISVGRSATALSTAAYGTLTIPSVCTGTINAFHSAVEAQGTVKWIDFDDSVGIVGGGMENVGNAFIISGIHLENEITSN